ncbi:MAG TPA: ROK family protein [Spirochaetia bacterium]|nr:ROK family protein [Spirochaetia bacterium]
MKILAGIDIGGTKCSASLATVPEDGTQQSLPEIVGRSAFPTPTGSEAALSALVDALHALCDRQGISRLDSIGVSCGGPLDSGKGLILSPPNLPGWDRVDAVRPFHNSFHCPTYLQNDANAGALAEWLWGAATGMQNVVFLTFGTGMGAGLILNGRLYSGTNDLAGEVGHFRLAPDGPVGYGKRGSFEGFCSGGGIARLASEFALAALDRGEAPGFCRTPEDIISITAEKVALAAREADPVASGIFDIVAKRLGEGLALIVDILNPEMIIIGSIYGRQKELLEDVMMERLRQEAIGAALDRCVVCPAGLGERVGDFAALAIAMYSGAADR